MTAPAIDVKKAVLLLWEMAEDPRNQREACMLRKIAGTLESQAAEIERLTKAVEGKRAA